MALQKPCSTNGNVKMIMTSLKQFEMKLDKLQVDVNYHGQTLKDLRLLVSNLSAATVTNPDGEPDDFKRALSHRVINKTNSATQYDHGLSNKVLPFKIKRKNAVQPLPLNIQAKVIQNQGLIKPQTSPYRMANKASSPRTHAVKRCHKTMRPSKADSPRKATTLRRDLKRDGLDIN